MMCAAAKKAGEEGTTGTFLCIKGCTLAGICPRRRMKCGEVTVHRLADGEALPSDAVYVVRQGGLRLESNGPQGFLPGFCLPGDTVYLETLEVDTPTPLARAIAETRACRIPLSSLKDILKSSPECYRPLADILSGLINKGHLHLLRLRMPADVRLGDFLLKLSSRLGRGEGKRVVVLPMSRVDIARHLGMRRETLSRLLSRFKNEGLIAVRGQHLSILKPRRLSRLSTAIA